MSTIVNYKGEPLTSAENQTRTLLTAGKYLEDDVEIIDTTPVLQMGVIRPDATLYKRYTFDKLFVEDMGLTIPAYSSSGSVSFKAAELIETITLPDLALYNYEINERVLTIPIYNISSVAVGRVEYQFGFHFAEITEVEANQFPAIVDPTKKGATSRGINGQYASRALYWSSGTAVAWTTSITYALHQTPGGHEYSGGDLSVYDPAIAARGSGTYMKNTYWNAMTDIRVQYVIEIFRVPKTQDAIRGWQFNSQIDRIAEAQNNGWTLT